MHGRLNGALVSPAGGLIDASPRPGEVYMNIDPNGNYAKHDGVLSLWPWASFIQSDDVTFLTQLAQDIRNISPNKKIDEIPWADVKRRVDSLLGLNNDGTVFASQGWKRAFDAARQSRVAAQNDLRARIEDWVIISGSTTQPPLPYIILDASSEANVNATNVAMRSAYVQFTSLMKCYTCCPYIFDANGWLARCGTAADLQNVSDRYVIGQWSAGYNGFTTQNHGADSQSVNHPFGDASAIMSRAINYSILRAVENAWEIRVGMLTAIKSEVDRFASGNQTDWGYLGAWADRQITTPYDVWVITEDPAHVQALNFVIGLNPITYNGAQELSLATPGGGDVDVHVDVPYVPPAESAEYDPSGLLKLTFNSKYGGLNALAAFRAGPDYSSKAWTQPLTSENKSKTPVKKGSGLLMLALAAAGVYVATK